MRIKRSTAGVSRQEREAERKALATSATFANWQYAPAVLNAESLNPSPVLYPVALVGREMLDAHPARVVDEFWSDLGTVCLSATIQQDASHPLHAMQAAMARQNREEIAAMNGRDYPCDTEARERRKKRAAVSRG